MVIEHLTTPTTTSKEFMGSESLAEENTERIPMRLHGIHTI